MEKCDLCGKEEEYDNCVWYFDEQFNLCKKHYKEWSKEHKPYVDSHKHIIPQTKKYHKMCEEEEMLFKKWFRLKEKELHNSTKR